MPDQTVLIIEDSRQQHRDCQQLLQDDASVSYRLLTQPDNVSVAALCQSQPIDGIVLNVSTAPLEVFSQIRQQLGQSCPPIVVVGDEAVETAVQLLKAGAADYLVRSRLTRQQLCAALQHALQPAIAHSTSASSSSSTQLEHYRHTETALQTANQKISYILESMTDAFVALDRNWRITYVNQTAARINNVPPDVLIGQSHWDVWSEARETLEERYQSAIATQTPAHFDYFYEARQRWYEIHAYPSADGLGIYFRDIHVRKQAETALQESEERFRTLADNMSQFAWMADSSGWIFWYNQRWFDYTGTTLEQMQGWQWQQVHHPDHLDRVVEHFSHSIRSGEPWEDTFPLRGKDGTFRWFLSRALPIRDEASNILRWFGTNTDITEQKQAEEALAQRETELRLVTNTVPALISFVDAEQRYRFVNHRYETWFGQPASAIWGKSLLEVLGEKAYETMRPHVEQVLAGQEVTYEVQIPYKDGGSRSVSATYVPRFSQQGAVEGFVALVNDISDRKRAEDEREQLLQREQAAREAAERANRVKDEFLTVLSHELRSPLNPILGWAKLLQKRQFDEAQTAQALAAIERNAKLQTQLIDDLLDVARILRGKLKLNQVPLSLANVVQSAIETMRKTAEAKSVALNANVPDIGQVYGDSTRLQQILWNLLSNAIKFTPSGGQVNIKLERVASHEVMACGSNRVPGLDPNEVRELEHHGRSEPLSSHHSVTPSPSHTSTPSSPHPSTHPPAYAQITVTDTGKGINPKFLPHIFESFRQEDASTTRQYGGLGLGLAIVRYLVNAHGGAIVADSAGEGFGATFTVCLPLLEVETAMQKTDEWSPQQDIDLAGMRILIVDDEPDARDLLEILLTQHGATIQAAASATEALAAMTAFQPELLISDIGMPGMDGYKLIQQIRTLPTEQGGNIPAIALTAYAREADSQQALASGYQQHIAKPLDLDKLLQTIVLLKSSSKHKK